MRDAWRATESQEQESTMPDEPDKTDNAPADESAAAESSAPAAPAARPRPAFAGKPAKPERTVKAICLVSRTGDRFTHSPGQEIEVAESEYQGLIEAGHIKPVENAMRPGPAARPR